jgi:alpha-galactosidase
MIARRSQDGRGLDVWIGRRAEGEVTFPTLGLSESQLDAVMQAAPKIGPWQKQPLLPPRAVPSNGLARTPPMGWSSWNLFRSSIDERTVREIADAMVSSGLRDAGYVYVNIDDGWQGQRDDAGVLNANEKFPDMKALADYLHARGLKLGVYSSPGLITYDGFIGSQGHEAQDARTFARWGVDYLKYDFGYAAATLYKTQPEIQALYQIMGEALQAAGRPIVYALSPELHDVGSWGRRVGANLWRTGGDSVAGDRWQAISWRFESNGKPEHAGPGGWNDADMMLVGLSGLTEEEYRTHFTLWAMSASPLILGNDIRTMTPAVQALLTNKEVIAVDQDAFGQQGRRALQMGQTEVWKKSLADGSTAVALFNRGEAPAEMQVRWKDLGIERVTALRNLWTRTNVQTKDSDFRATVPPHGTVLLRVESASNSHLERPLTTR